jgi:hypothetical protein
MWRMLGSVISATGVPIVRFAEALNRLGLGIGPLFGGFDEGADKSVAARRPRRTTAEGIQQSAAEASIMASAAARDGRKPETTESFLKQILDFLNQTFGPQAIQSFIIALAKAIRENLPGLGNVPNPVAVARRPWELLDFIRD